MFSKGGEMGTAEDDTGHNSRSRLAHDLKITGNLKAAGTIEVQGEVQGDIDAGKLLVGPDGHVNGKIRAEIVEVQGKLDGSASCRQFTLRSSAVAHAQVTYEGLVIESGATIEGRFKHAKT